jgi:hypothetical protein
MIVRAKGIALALLLGVAFVSLLVAGGQCLAAPLGRDDPLSRARDAVRANASAIRSYAGIVSFEGYYQEPEDEKLQLNSKGRANVYYDGGRYHFRVKYETRLVKVRQVGRPGERVVEGKPDDLAIIYDGTKAQVVTYSRNIRPANCEIEVFRDLDDVGHLVTADPARFLLHFVGLDEQLRTLKRDAIAVTDLGSGTWRISFEPKAVPKAKVEVEVSSKAGYNPTRYRVVLPGWGEPTQEYSARWKKVGDIYYVEQVVMVKRRLHHHETGYRMSMSRSVFQYKSFEPNVKVDAKLFTLDCLAIPPRTRTLDLRPEKR